MIFIFRMNEVIVGDEPVNLRLQEIDLLQEDDTEGIEQIFLLKHSDTQRDFGSKLYQLITSLYS